VAARGLPVVGLDRKRGEGALPGQAVGILLHEPQILAIGLADIAARALGLGVAQARLAMRAVQLEDIAELHEGAIHIALFQKFQAGLEMALGPLLGGVAKGQEACGGQCEKRGFDHETTLAPLTRDGNPARVSGWPCWALS